MQGVTESPELRGIIPNTFHHVFAHIARTPERQYLVRVSYLEIYNEEIRDLLNPHQNKGSMNFTHHSHGLDIKEHPEHGLYVKDLTSVAVKSVEELQNWMQLGNEHRSVGVTNMNLQSSRSHAIFTIKIESSGENEHIWGGQLHLVDLAGSERQSKTGAQGDRLKEAAKINLSLSALGNCISALVDGKSQHVPYRDSKLTRLLQDSLGGNSKTVMVATISPASYNYEETLSTLRYANRAKNITNQPIINEDPKDALLRAYQEEIKRLQEQLKLRSEHFSNSDSPILSASLSQEIKAEDAMDEEKKRKQKDLPFSLNFSNDSPASSINISCLSLEPNKILQLQKEIEEERRKMMESKELANEEKERLIQVLEGRLNQLEEEKKQKEELVGQLHSLEAKLLMGGINIIDRVNQQEKELELKRIKKMEEERIQRELKQLLDQKQEENTFMEEEYVSLQEEVDVKTRKIQKLWKKLDTGKREIEDINEEWRLERLDLMATLRELSREIELKQMILEYFVPSDSLKRIRNQLVYDEDQEEWIWNSSFPTSPPSSLSLAPPTKLTSETASSETKEKRKDVKEKEDGSTNAQPSNEIEKLKNEESNLLQKPSLDTTITSGITSLSTPTSLYPQYRRPICKMARELLNKEKIARYCIDNLLDVPLLSPEHSTIQSMQPVYAKLRLASSTITSKSKAKEEKE
ncbi:Kinesin-like protein kif3b [Coelomomyces lativittatus]|nr:Kinesin-like protein kif3b [Coelomomyces lativittatus]